MIGLFFASIGFIFTRLYCSTLLISDSIVSVNQPLQIINWDIPNVVKVYYKKAFHADYFLYYVIKNTAGNIINAVCYMYRKGGCNGHQ